MKPSAVPDIRCVQCGEVIRTDEWGSPLRGSDEYAETARGLVHVSCMQPGEEIA